VNMAGDRMEREGGAGGGDRVSTGEKGGCLLNNLLLRQGGGKV